MKTKVLTRLMILTAVAGTFSASSVPTTASPTDSSSLSLVGTLRDFKAGYNGSGQPLEGGHPDFERKPGTKGRVYGSDEQLGQNFRYGLDRNIVQSTIGGDRKPVFKGTTKSTTTKQYFDQWYRDVNGVNQKMDYTIVLRDDDGDGTYTYQSSSFFPLDGKLFGDQGRSHNYHFTFEVHNQFTYIPGTPTKPRTFKFTGDDDVWVYLNGKKVIDLGGVHSAESQEVNLDELADELGLIPGRTYDFDFFFAERHTTKSNFRIDTSIAFAAD